MGEALVFLVPLARCWSARPAERERERLAPWALLVPAAFLLDALLCVFVGLLALDDEGDGGGLDGPSSSEVPVVGRRRARCGA